MSAQTRSSSWPLIARERELSAFEAVWNSRHCRGVMIYGPAGVGKTRLAEECVARAVRGGWNAKKIKATSAAASIPLSALSSIIPNSVDMSDPVKVFSATARGLAEANQRWIVWIDDLHFLDATSAVLLRQLINSGVIRVVGTLRTTEKVSEAVAMLTSGDAIHRIDVSLLNEHQVDAVLHAALGQPVGRSTLRTLYQASGGNLLFLRELILGAEQDRTLVHHGEIYDLSVASPTATPELSELIEKRLSTVDRAGREVLELMSLVEPLALADAESLTCTQVLAQMETNGLIHVITSGRRTALSLAHPLYGEVLRSSLSAEHRGGILLQQVERIMQYGAKRWGDVVQIAILRLSATGTADPFVLTQAARLACHAHDYSQVITLLGAVPDSKKTTEARLMMGIAYRGIGSFDKADTALAEIDLQAVKEADVLAVVALRTINLFWTGRKVIEAFHVNKGARPFICSDEGIEALDINAASMEVLAGRLKRGNEVLQRLDSKKVESALDVNTCLYGLGMKTIGLALAGEVESAIEAGQQAHTVHKSLDRRAFMPHPSTQLTHLSMALAEAGRLSEAHVVAQQACADLQGETIASMLAEGQLGRISLLRGHLFEARRAFAESAVIARTVGSGALKQSLSGIAAAAVTLSDLDGAEAALSEMERTVGDGYLAGKEINIGRSHWLVAVGRREEAKNLLVEEAEQAKIAGYVSTEAWILTDLARLGWPEQAAGRLEELAENHQGRLIAARFRLACALMNNDPLQLASSSVELQEIGAELLAAEAAMAASAAFRAEGDLRAANAVSRKAIPYRSIYRRARTPLLSAAQESLALTRREQEIAQLAASGLSSQEIANQLTISVRTINNHLQGIYKKLGITNRQQLMQVFRENP
ncbi:LuxR C-terminal-related transcriptional regulator [Streptomyces sp. NPDC002952]|uniref:helix-turn-helix transcriptional regulator n=1 Tax=Streptomyces sp. NPDC002952 TaxID=3364673 RepID=UPI0036B2DC0D